MNFQTKHRKPWLFSLVALLLLMVFIVGCGGDSSSTQNNNQASGGTSSSSDSDQIKTVVTTFCSDLGSNNAAGAFSLLPKATQFQLETPNTMLTSMASAIFDTDYRGQHPNYSGGYSAGQYTVTGCTITSDPLINGGQAKIHVHFNFSDNSYSPAELDLNNADGSWKIYGWGYDSTGCSATSCP